MEVDMLHEAGQALLILLGQGLGEGRGGGVSRERLVRGPQDACTQVGGGAGR